MNGAPITEAEARQYTLRNWSAYDKAERTRQRFIRLCLVLLWLIAAIGGECRFHWLNALFF